MTSCTSKATLCASATIEKANVVIIHRIKMAEQNIEDHDYIEEQDRVLEMKRVKRSRKTAVTKVKHTVEKLCAKKYEDDNHHVELIEKEVDNLLDLLERALEQWTN